jgi:hypothetical protein
MFPYIYTFFFVLQFQQIFGLLEYYFISAKVWSFPIAKFVNSEYSYVISVLRELT